MVDNPLVPDVTYVKMLKSKLDTLLKNMCSDDVIIRGIIGDDKSIDDDPIED
jgi:hypothetical protein